jgi:hypothetical protein
LQEKRKALDDRSEKCIVIWIWKHVELLSKTTTKLIIARDVKFYQTRLGFTSVREKADRQCTSLMRWSWRDERRTSSYRRG